MGIEEKAKMKIDAKLCAGCRICEMVCDLTHNSETGEINPKRAHIKITGQFPIPGGFKIKFSECNHCGECARWCPQGAISLKDNPADLAENVSSAPALSDSPVSYPNRRLAMSGYAGRILFLDLSKKAKKKWISRRLTKSIVEKYLGGRGLAAYLLYKHNPKGIDPLSPKNNIVIASGPLSGTFVPAGGKITFASKSPLTGGYGDSNMGGHLASELKYAGYDAIVIKGRAEKPSMIVIDDGAIGIRDASKYWGKGAIDAEKMLKDDLGEDFQIAVIGPAGENLVRFACISHDFGRQAGRAGMGAVLGAKNIKAICVRGSKGIPIHDISVMIEKGKAMFRECAENPVTKIWQRCGTPGVTGWVNEIGAFPSYNFKNEWYVFHKNLLAEVMREKIVVSDKSCFGCPMACGKYSHAKKESKYDVYVEGPEYETIALCGGNCGFKDIADIAYANWVCDNLGIDTISTGGVIAFAIECFKKGIITLEMTEGKNLEWGDTDSFSWLAEKIAKQVGIGAVLSLGTKKAAQILGNGADKFAIQIKGMEQSGYGIRAAMAMALSYMTCDVGAHHNRSWAITYDLEKGRKQIEGKAERVVYLQHVRPMFDMLGVCRLQWVELGLSLEHYPEILKSITGFDFNLNDLLKISERIWNLTRSFWKRENPDFGRAYDQPPKRFLEEEIAFGPTCGEKLTQEAVDKLLNDYYRLRGWTDNGLPTKEKLQELGLDIAIKDLYPEG